MTSRPLRFLTCAILAAVIVTPPVPCAPAAAAARPQAPSGHLPRPHHPTPKVGTARDVLSVSAFYPSRGGEPRPPAAAAPPACTRARGDSAPRGRSGMRCVFRPLRC